MNESVVKTLLVSFVVCFVCSLVVSYSAVSLRDAQETNKLNDKRSKILQAAGIFDESVPVEDQFSKLEQKFVDFSTGQLIEEVEGLVLSTYDPVEFSKKSWGALNWWQTKNGLFGSLLFLNQSRVEFVMASDECSPLWLTVFFGQGRGPATRNVGSKYFPWPGSTL